MFRYSHQNESSEEVTGSKINTRRVTEPEV